MLALPAAIAFSIAIAPPAQANHIAGATYAGTAATGTVELEVSTDGASVTRFSVTDVPTTCGTITGTATGTFPITNHSFSNGNPSIGARFAGAFPATQQAQGTFSFRSAYPSCTSDTVNWSATTTAEPLPPPPPPPPPPNCVVPRVKGKPLAAARSAINRANCSVGRVRKAFSAKVRKRRVISQRPRPGASLPQGARVNLVVSKGKRRR